MTEQLNKAIEGLRKEQSDHRQKMENYWAEIGQELMTARRLAGLSKSGLAAKAGLTHPVVVYVESGNGYRQVSVDALDKLLVALKKTKKAE